MEFRISDTFTDSLARLTGEEQKLVKTTAFDLQTNPTSQGMSFHKLDQARDKNFWSVRVSRDIRIIVHKTDASLLLCYVDHHDKAYAWAERRRLEVHPTTGAAQLVEIRERVEEIVVRYKVERPEALVRKKLFASITDDVLLGYGVPQDWLADVRDADEDSLLDIANHLPAEAAEALLELATGGTPQVQSKALLAVDFVTAFAHPDAQRRFRVIQDSDELERALEFPWEKWTVFLHPAQRQWVERDYSGPTRVSGSAGTGKTIVALHRAVFIARNQPDSRVLLTTFSDTLASSLQTKLRRLIHNEPRLGERLEVHSMEAIGERLYAKHLGKVSLVTDEQLRQWLREASSSVPAHKFSERFIFGEWTDIVDAWQLNSWETYRDFKRLGRKTRLPEQQRSVLWEIFTKLKARLAEAGSITEAEMFSKAAEALATRKHPPFEHIIVDEAQDISPSQLRFLAAIGGERANNLFFAGDTGQRIFQQPFSWKALGVDIRGRARTLTINYRTSHQIRRQADRLLGPEVSDADGNVESRRNTVSVFNGPQPEIETFPSEQAEISHVADWLQKRGAEGMAAHEIGIFVRSDAQLDRAKAALTSAAVPYRLLDARVETVSGHANLCTMHLAKGLEFRAVAIMACDDEVIPLLDRIEAMGDDGDLESTYNTERQLLYVACTRARDMLLITACEPESEFLGDMQI